MKSMGYMMARENGNAPSDPIAPPIMMTGQCYEETLFFQ